MRELFCCPTYPVHLVHEEVHKVLSTSVVIIRVAASSSSRRSSCLLLEAHLRRRERCHPGVIWYSAVRTTKRKPSFLRLFFPSISRWLSFYAQMTSTAADTQAHWSQDMWETHSFATHMKKSSQRRKKLRSKARVATSSNKRRQILVKIPETWAYQVAIDGLLPMPFPFREQGLHLGRFQD